MKKKLPCCPNCGILYLWDWCQDDYINGDTGKILKWERKKVTKAEDVINLANQHDLIATQETEDIQSLKELDNIIWSNEDNYLAICNCNKVLSMTCLGDIYVIKELDVDWEFFSSCWRF